MTEGRPLKLIVAALGGQGGGVVSDWMVTVAKLENYLVQATSVPGVAQRTGATIYYMEFFPRTLLPGDGREPVLALMPHPGDVDVVVASEIMEAGRAIQRGVVTRDKTTLIASSNRVYAIGEKTHLTDGRADSQKIAELAAQHAKRFIMFDMQEIATKHSSVISAAILGSLAGSGAFPFAHASYRKAIEEGGIAVKQSLAAFEAAAEAAKSARADGVSNVAPSDPVIYRSGLLPDRLVRALQNVPEAVRATVEEGVRRLVDYQDVSYALQYLQRLEPFLKRDAERAGSRTAVAADAGSWAGAGGVVGAAGSAAADYRLSEAVARTLALWMSFEDTIRVADLKIRATRAQRVSEEVRAGSGQLVSVTEFMKPRVEEICGTLPASLGRGILKSPSLRGLVARFTGSRQVSTSHVGSFTLLYLLAGMRRWRRSTLRFAEETALIDPWLAEIERIAAQDNDLAIEVAECQRLVRGYGDTHARGTRNFALIVGKAREALGSANAAARVRELRNAATADEDGVALQRALAG